MKRQTGGIQKSISSSFGSACGSSCGFSWGLLLFLALGASACHSEGDSTSGLSSLSGHYEGTLTTRLTGQAELSSVKVDVPTPKAAPVILDLKDEKGAERLKLELSPLRTNGASSIRIRSSLGLPNPVTLSQNQGCFDSSPDLAKGAAHPAPPQWSISLCAQSPQLSFDVVDARGVPLLSLVLYRFDSNGKPPEAEKPRTFTLAQAIERARAASFTSKIEYERVIQAKLTARAAYLLLLPKINANTALNNITPSFITALGSIGDLAPFLFPDKWLAAKETSDEYRAELDTEKLTRLDMGVLVESLFYAYDRDKTTYDLTLKLIQQVTQVRDEVDGLEQGGVLPTGSTLSVNSTLNQLEGNEIVLSQLVAEDLTAISQALGFFNPHAVSDALLDPELIPIEHAPTLDAEAIAHLAHDRSYELDQMSDLIKAAKAAKTAKYFSFLDPSGDPNLSLGAALPSQIQISSSQLRELDDDRQVIEQTLWQKSVNGVTDYQTAIQAYAKAQEGLSIQQQQLDLAVWNLDHGITVDFAGLTQIYQNYVNAEVTIESARATYRIARAKIDRLLLQGYYAKF